MDDLLDIIFYFPPEAILGYIVSVYILYILIRNNAPWQMIIFGIFSFLTPLGRHMQDYYEIPRIIRFYLSDFSAIPMFVIATMFLSSYISQVKEYYKEHLLMIGFCGLIGWLFDELFIKNQIDPYDLLAYHLGFIITVVIISTMDKKENYMEYIFTKTTSFK